MTQGYGRATRRRWEPDRLALRPVGPEGDMCRVCGQPIPPGSTAWRWTWRSTRSAHEGCGWYTPDDMDGVSAAQTIQRWRHGEAPSDHEIRRCHRLGMLRIVRTSRGAQWAVTQHYERLAERMASCHVDGRP
jgi:hypothetical protein